MVKNQTQILCRVVLVISMFLGIHAAGAENYLSVGKEKSLLQELYQMGGQEFIEKSKVASESYEIVFIPGMLGSKLTINRNGSQFTFGADTLDSKQLLFDDLPSESIKSDTLDNFYAKILGFDSRKDVYGSGLQGLKDLNGKEPLVFSYDWRADINDTARKLNDWAQQKLGGKRVVIVAHSMGGLVAWHWKNTYYSKKEKKPFTWIAAIFLGTPFSGSCEPARMLIEGYKAPSDSNIFEEVATNYVFKNAHAAIFTFPSIYQLLPEYNEQSPCMVLRKSGGVDIPLDHHNVRTWLDSKENSKRKGYYNVDVYAKEAGIDENRYSAMVRNAVEKGETFRKLFIQNSSDDDPRFITVTPIEIGQ